MNWFRTDRAVLWSWSLIWFTLPLWNLGNSLSIILFGIITLTTYLYKPHKIRNEAFVIPGLFAAFFLMHILSDVFAGNGIPAWADLERKLALLFIPGLILLLKPDLQQLKKFAFIGLSGGVAVGGLVMLLFSTVSFLNSGYWDEFLYHSLTQPFKLGAIYFSLLLATLIIVMCVEEQKWLSRKLYYSIFIFFCLLLFLAASKLFVVLTLPFILYKFIRRWHLLRHKTLITALVGVALLAGLYPVITRYAALSDLNLEVLEQKNIGPETHFNGINLRLLQWKFGLEILSEQDAWVFGTGISVRQHLLNEKYVEYNMYTGNENSHDSGFLNMNFHNQWMETLVGNGLVGLILLITIIIWSFGIPKTEFLFPLPVLIVLLLFFFTESVIERQIGLIFLIFNFSKFTWCAKNP